MNKKDRIAIVISIVYFFMFIPVVLQHADALVLYTPVILYWGYRFIKNDISFLKIKDN